MRVHHLRCGTLCPFATERLMTGRGSATRRVEIVCHVLLLELDDTLVLVDTGFGTDDLADPKGRLGPARHLLQAQLDPKETVLMHLERLGRKPSDVGHIVLTHLDLDHAGALSDFPRAKVHLLAAEKRGAVDAPDRKARGRYRSIQWAHGPDWNAVEPEGEPWRGFAAARELEGLPPEILMVPLLGHSPGHAGVAIDSGEGWLLHAGDAYFTRCEITHPIRRPLGFAAFERVTATDFGLMRRNQERLADLLQGSKGDLQIFSAHDPEELRAFG